MAYAINEYFYLREFIPAKAIKMLTIERALLLLNDQLVAIATQLRKDNGGPLYINTKANPNRGFRSMYSKTGSPKSAHKLMMAIDVSSDINTPAELLKIIKSKEALYFKLGLRRIEDIKFTKTWLHLDLIPTGKDKIEIFKPY